MNNYGTGMSLKAKFIKCRDEFLGCGSIEADQTSSKQYEVNIRHSLSDKDVEVLTRYQTFPNTP